MDRDVLKGFSQTLQSHNNVVVVNLLQSPTTPHCHYSNKSRAEERSHYPETTKMKTARTKQQLCVCEFVKYRCNCFCGQIMRESSTKGDLQVWAGISPGGARRTRWPVKDTCEGGAGGRLWDGAAGVCVRRSHINQRKQQNRPSLDLGLSHVPKIKQNILRFMPFKTSWHLIRVHVFILKTHKYGFNLR